MGSPAGEAPGVAGSIRVVCRLRPMSERERKAGTVPAASASTERKEVAVVRVLGSGIGGGARQVRSLFHFDEVLTSFSTQSEVFAATLDPLVDEVLAGYEATAFAYGQTGTGKTYTMEGELDSDVGRGLVPRTAQAIIDRLTRGKYADYSISCSYLEIYNEDLTDLLVPAHIQAPKLHLKDVGNGKGVVCSGLSEVPVRSLSDILDLVRIAQDRRHVAETRINARSSRSHCIFTLKVKCRRLVAAGELENSGKLHLVDLAGSECAKKATLDDGSGHSSDKKTAWSDEDRERKNINQSLLTLGRVITALRDGTGRVPYRDSKLTRLLQDALGGRCKTVVIATISPALNAVEETISTLSYAEQASGVKNRPVATSLLRTIRLGGALADVGATLSGGAGGSNMDWAELEMKIAYLNQEVEEAQAALAVQYREVEEHMERATLAENKLMDAETNLEAAKREGEEQAFLATSLASFADGRVAAASVLSSALDASLVHGQDLGRCLAQSSDRTLAARRQARAALEAVAAQAAELSAAAEARAARLGECARAAYAAHRTSTEAAAELTKEQEQALGGLLSATHGAAQLLEKALAATGCEAKAAIEEGEAACAAASSSAQAAMQEAVRAAERGGEEVGAAMAAGEAVMEQQAASAQADIVAAQRSLRDSAAAVAKDSEAARGTSTSMHEAQSLRMREGIQEKLTQLGRHLLECAGGLAVHVAALDLLRAKESENVVEEESRRRQVLAELETVKEGHAASASAGHAALRASLGDLGAALRARHGASDSSLGALAADLAAASACSTEATARGGKAAADALSDANATLTDAWTVQRQSLQGLASTLSTAASDQRAANVGTALKAGAADTALQLAGALAAAVAALSEVRDEVAGQVEQLQAQRTAEAAATAALAAQRVALSADVVALSADVGALRAELAEGRGKLDSMVAAQSRAREKVLQVVAGVLEKELAGIGTELEVATTAVCGHLSSGEETAEEVRRKAMAAEETSAEATTKVSHIVQEWSKSIGDRCEAVCVAQERARAAVVDVETASSAAEGRLGKSGAACEKWGDQCEEVAALVDNASAVCGTSSAGVEELEARWHEARVCSEAVTKAWIEDGGRTLSQLEVVASHGETAKKELGSLRDEVSQHNAAAEGVASQWQQDSQAHGASLSQLASLSDNLAKVGLEEAGRRAEALQGLCQKAADLTAATKQRCADNEKICSAVASEIEALPSAFQQTDSALASTSAATEALAQDASEAFSVAGEGISALQAKQTEVARGACGSAEAAAEAVAAAITRGVAAQCDQRAAAEESAKRVRSLWKRAGNEQREALQALSISADAAKDTSKTATLRGCDRVLAELDRGKQTENEAVEEAQNVASGTAAALDDYLKSLRSSLSAAPLAAFEDELDAPPSRPADAGRPEVELLGRPTKEQLLADFRAPAFVGKENAPELRFQAKVDGSIVWSSGKEASKEASKELSKEPRVALAERNATPVLA